MATTATTTTTFLNTNHQDDTRLHSKQQQVKDDTIHTAFRLVRRWLISDDDDDDDDEDKVKEGNYDSYEDDYDTTTLSTQQATKDDSEHSSTTRQEEEDVNQDTATFVAAMNAFATVATYLEGLSPLQRQDLAVRCFAEMQHHATARSRLAVVKQQQQQEPRLLTSKQLRLPRERTMLQRRKGRGLDTISTVQLRVAAMETFQLPSTLCMFQDDDDDDDVFYEEDHDNTNSSSHTFSTTATTEIARRGVTDEQMVHAIQLMTVFLRDIEQTLRLQISHSHDDIKATIAEKYVSHALFASLRQIHGNLTVQAFLDAGKKQTNKDKSVV